MSLDPLKPSNLPQPDAGRVAPGQAARRPAPPARADERAAAPDSVELSSASRGLADGAEPVPEGTIPAERLREVARKMEQEFYDTPEVRDAVARRALRDLGSLEQE